MPSFVTQEVESSPAVLLISSKHPAQELFEKLVEDKKLQLTSWSWEQAASHLLNAKQMGFYKVILLVGRSDVEQQSLDDVLQLLRQRGESVVLFTSINTGVEGVHPALEVWNQRQQQKLLWLRAALGVLPKMQLLLAQDLLSDWTSDLDSPLLQSLQGTLARDVLGNSAFAPLTLERLSEKMANQLFKPSSDRPVVFQAPFLRFVQVLIGLDPALEHSFLKDLSASSIKKQELFKFPHQVVRVEQPRVGVLDATQKLFLKTTPRVSEAKLMVEPIKPRRLVDHERPPSVVRFSPQKIPQIENRQKKYEQGLQEIHRQRGVHQRLRPVLPEALQNTPPFDSERQLSGRPPGFALRQLSGRPPGFALRQFSAEQELEEAIQGVFGEERVGQKVVRIKKKAVVTARAQRKQGRQKKLSRVVVFLSLLGLVGLLLSGLFLISRQQVFAALTQAFPDRGESGRTVLSPQKLRFFGNLLQEQVRLYQLVLGEKSLKESSVLATIATETEAMGQKSAQIHSTAETALGRITGQQEESPFPALIELASQTQDLYKSLSLLQSRFQGLNLEYLPDEQQQSLRVFLTALQEKRRSLALGDQFQQLLPSLLAADTKKTFAVVLQNSQELRPTGGLIHAVALVTIENGKVIDQQFFEAAPLSALTPGSAEAPADFQKYLGQSQVGLRDANWSPNFAVSAEQIAGFLERGLGRSVDGVVGINLHTLQELIQVIGPIELPEYNEVVTQKNLFERVEFHSELKLIQKGKPDYLTLLLGKVVLKTLGTPGDQLAHSFSPLYRHLNNGQMLLYSRENTENLVFGSLGWGGEVATPQCPTQLQTSECLVDTAMQVEANVGLNRSNYSLQRKIYDQIFVDPTQVRHQRTIEFKNTAVTNAWPAGSYKTYLRLYVPTEAKIEGADIDGTPVPIGSMSIGGERDKKYFGFLVEVPIQKTVRVNIRYGRAHSFSSNFAYSFFDQKQAGTPDEELKVEVILDSSLKPDIIAPQAEVQGNIISFSTLRDQHTFVGIKFR